MEKTIKVSKIHCGHCVATIKNELSELPGVTSVDADVVSKRVTVRWEPSIDWGRIAETLKEIGFPPDDN